MKLGKIFICINILVLSLLMLTGWPRIIYQNTSYRFDEYNRTIVLDCRNGKWLFVHSFAIGEKYIEIGRVTYATIYACESIEARIPQYQNNYSGIQKLWRNYLWR